MLLLFLLLYSCSAIVSPNNASLKFRDEKYDFGKIPFNQEVSFLFEFSNISKTPLIIHNVKTSCGCTIPEWTKVPIKPAGKGNIKIKYDAAFPGVFHKTIVVYYNGPDSPSELEISGEVEGVEE